MHFSMFTVKWHLYRLVEVCILKIGRGLMKETVSNCSYHPDEIKQRNEIISPLLLSKCRHQRVKQADTVYDKVVRKPTIVFRNSNMTFHFLLSMTHHLLVVLGEGRVP